MTKVRPIAFLGSVLVAIAGCLVSDTDARSTDVARVYRGSISEAATEGDEVLLNIPLSVSNRDGLDPKGEVCGYTVYKWHSEMPFKVVLLDRQTGDAKIVLEEGYQLDYETKHKYSFDIAAYDCTDGNHANRERVHVYIDDANEFDPVWTNNSYVASIEEGLARKDVVQVQATDADGSPGLSKICQYHIMNPDVPFDIDDSGVLRNTEVLDSKKTNHYQLVIKAEDCGGRVSDDAVVNIQVLSVCKRGLTGVSETTELVGIDRQSLLPEAVLEVCDSTCQTERVSVTVRLQTSHIGLGCDRDDLSVRQHRRDCGASLNYIDLLPDPVSEGSWTGDLPTVDMAENTVFAFDGQTTAVQVPASDLEPHALGTSFSISTWMKHERESRDIKEHIVCAADGEGMNRHHYALFVHNCRLVLLLRRQPEMAPLDALSPAEWRWKLPEVCDGNWHHYVISVGNEAQVRLHLDGRVFVADESEFEVLDDWPLHRSRLAHTTKVYVGACWQGTKNHANHYFKGQLSGLVILKNSSESDETIECLNKCQEKLELSTMDAMETGMSVSVNAAQNVLTVNGLTTSSVQQMLRQLSYVNNRLFPSPAVRPVSIETHVKCTDGRQPTYDVINMSIDVGQTDTLVLILNGTTSMSRDEHHLMVGDKVFYDLTIAARQRLPTEPAVDPDASAADGSSSKISEGDDVTDRLRIGLCHVHVEPSLNLDSEHLTLTSDLTESLQLELTSSETGLTIAGVASVPDYQQLIRSVRYVNSKPHDFNRRQFVVGCTEAGDHVTSNQLRVTLDMIHHQPAAAPPAPQHIMKEPKPAMSDSLRLVGKSFPASLKYDSQQTGVGVAVVMIVCVGFIVVLIVLGVMRVRNNRNCSADQLDDKPEMDWDNSALTITVNPMHPDNEADADDQDQTGCSDDEDSEECDSEDDGIVYRDVTGSASNKKMETLGRGRGVSANAEQRQIGTTTLVL